MLHDPPSGGSLRVTAQVHRSRMRWVDFEADAAELAAIATLRLAGPGVVLVGTVRTDGTARISACEPFFHDGELWLPMLQGSTKVRDLLRDPRVLVHSAVSNRDGIEGEVKVRGHARREGRRVAEVCRAIGAALPFEPDPARVDLFAVDVGSVAHVGWSPEGDQHVTLWPQRRRFVRRITSATSLGPEQAT